MFREKSFKVVTIPQFLAENCFSPQVEFNQKIASKSGAFAHQKRTANRFWDNLFKDSGSGRGVRTASHLFRKMAMSNDIYLR
jgi:hypothetical protein